MSEKLRRILAVTGKGVEKIEATSAQVRLGIEARGEVAAEVQQEVASKSSAVVDLLRGRNVTRLKTIGIRLSTYYEGSNRDIVKYIGTNIVNFCVPIDDVSILLHEKVQAGVSRVDGVNFTATEEAISGAKQEALTKATIDAKNKAEVVLSTLGFTLQEIINIEIDEAHFQKFQPFTRHVSRNRRSSRVTEDASFSEMPVVGGELTVNASVTLQISY